MLQTPNRHHSKDSRIRGSSTEPHYNDRQNSSNHQIDQLLRQSDSLNASFLPELNIYTKFHNSLHAHTHEDDKDRSEVDSQSKSSKLQQLNQPWFARVQNSVIRAPGVRLPTDEIDRMRRSRERALYNLPTNYNYNLSFNTDEVYSERPFDRTPEPAINLKQLSPSKNTGLQKSKLFAQKMSKKAYGQYLLNQIATKAEAKKIEKIKQLEVERKMLNGNSFFDKFGSESSGHTKDRNLNPIINRSFDLNGLSNRRDAFSVLGTEASQEYKKTDITVWQAKERVTVPRKSQDFEQDSLDKEPKIYTSLNGFDSLSKDSFEDRTQIQLQNGGVGHLNTEFESDFGRNHGLDTSQNKKLGPVLSENQRTGRRKITQASNLTKKEDYRRSLELQMLENKLKKAHANEVRKLEDQIEQLKASRDQIKIELDKKSASPQTKDLGSKTPTKVGVNKSSIETPAKLDRARLNGYTPMAQVSIPEQKIQRVFDAKKGGSTQESHLDKLKPVLLIKRDKTQSNSRQIEERSKKIHEEVSLLREEVEENSIRLQAEIAKFRLSAANQRWLEKLEKGQRVGSEDSTSAPNKYRAEIIRDVPAIIQTPFTVGRDVRQTENAAKDQEGGPDDKSSRNQDDVDHVESEKDMNRKESEYFMADESYIPYTAKDKPKGVRRVKNESKNEPHSKHLRQTDHR